jgi:hypothetical protein
MQDWSEDARDALAAALARIRREAREAGADPEEVESDLRAHLLRDLAASGVTSPSAEDVVQRIARYRGPDRAATPGSAEGTHSEPASPANRPDAPAVGSSARAAAPAGSSEGASRSLPPLALPDERYEPGWFASTVLLVGGVLLPIAAVGFESATHMCAGMFFDPLPTPWHVAWIATIPVVSAWTQWFAPRSGPARRRLALLNGFACIAAAYYTLLFLPLLPMAAIGIAMMGIGLLGFAPLFALIATLVARRMLQPRDTSGSSRWRPGFGHGALAGLAVLAAMWIPSLLGDWAIDGLNDESAARRAKSLWTLRHLVPESTLLERCYPNRPSEFGEGSALGERSRAERLQQARSAFWLATGESFSARPPPATATHRRAASGPFGFSGEDAERGGVEVGGRVEQLALQGSRLDGLCDADALCGYLEWTLVFRNQGTLPAEARCEILLPSQATVSRLTLWIDGEPREAAFAPTAQVRAAYQNVVQVQRRDPALITPCGPDRVRLQCFPVPAGGEMQVRIGISTPLQLVDAARASFELPRLMDRNFDLPEDLPRALWLRAPRSLALAGESASVRGADAERYQWSGERIEAACTERAHPIVLERDPQALHVWAPSGSPEGPECLLQSTQATRERAQRLVIVVDGSVALDACRDEIAAALRVLPQSLELGLIAALDEPVVLLEPGAHTAEQVADAFERIEFAGGRECAPALVAALERTHQGGSVLWLHGPQPWIASEPTRLQQLCEREDAGARLWSVALAPGRQRLYERLPRWYGLRRLERVGTLAEDLARFASRCAGLGEVWDVKRVLCEPQALPADARGPASPHVTKLALRERIETLYAGHSAQRSEAQRLAYEHALVTSCSGAVVLERAQQYQANGLTPVDPDQAPSVPEPATLVLAWLGIAALLASRLRARSAVA